MSTKPADAPIEHAARPTAGDTTTGDTTTSDTTTGEASAAAADSSEFTVRLTNFSGPFDLLLQLISKHKLDITEVALSVVTDDFIAHIRAAGDAWDLEQTSQFVLVAATLLDLKAARLLPQGEVEDPEDLALLEARDLLFARLLQYRAFKEVAAWLAQVLDSQGRRFARPGGLEPFYARLLPDVVIRQTPDEFAALAARAMTPRAPDEVSLAHLHTSTVTVREQAMVVVDRLRRSGSATFRALTADAPDRVTTVCRFLALLELFRSGAVAFDQLTPLGELTIRWTEADDRRVEISDEFDAPAGEQAGETDAPEQEAPEQEAPQQEEGTS